MGLLRLAVLVAIALIASAILAGPTLGHHRPGHNPPGHGGSPPGHGPKDKGPKDKGPKDKGPKDKGPKGGVHDSRGTVKIHEGAAEPAVPMANQPQVCEFHVHGFKFHDGQQLTISIAGQGGNPGPDQVNDTVTTSGDGGFRYPTTGTLTLADGSYKLTVLTGHGNGGKHKVFQVDCDETGNQPPGSGGDEGGQPNPGGGDQGNGPRPGGGDQGNSPTPGGGDQGDSPTPGGGYQGNPPNGPTPGSGPGAGNPDAPVSPPKPGNLPDTAIADEHVDSATASLTLAITALMALGGFLFVARRRFAIN